MADRSTTAVMRRFSGTELTIPGVLDAQADERPDQALLVIDGTEVTYAGLRSRSIGAAAALADLGVVAGDRVAIFMSTSVEWVALWFGASRLGAVAVPVNTAFRGDFLARQLAAAHPRVVAVDEALADRLAAVAGDVPSLEAVLVRPEGGAGAVTGPWSHDGRRIEVRSTSSLPTDAGAGGSAEPGGPSWDSPAAIFYTSGTTGPSKGAVATHHYLLTAAQTIADLWELAPGEAVYAPLPLFHLSAIGSVLGPMLSGGTGVLDRAFSVHGTWDQVRRHHAVGLVAAGAMVTMLWSLPPEPGDADLPIRFLSAAPVSKELYAGIERRWGCRIVTCYGLSEAFPLTVTGQWENPPGASGRANPDFDVAIVDADDAAVPAGDVGEIVCRPRRSQVMFEGYDGRPAETLEQCRNLWFHTGDLARFDEDGNLYYVDRKKDAMRRRGENISSFEVEQSLLQYQGVAEVAAIGVPSDLGEDDVMVCVVAAEGTTIDHRDLMDFCSERLPYFAVPRYVEVLPELPKNAMGRVLKHELRARGVSPSAWDREKEGYVVKR